MARISERLASIAEQSAPDRPIEMVMELAPSSPATAPAPRSRADRRALTLQRRAEFDACVARLEPVLRAIDATVHETTWLNDSLVVVAPASRLADIARIDGIELLDVAAPLAHD